MQDAIRVTTIGFRHGRLVALALAALASMAAIGAEATHAKGKAKKANPAARCEVGSKSSAALKVAGRKLASKRKALRRQQRSAARASGAKRRALIKKSRATKKAVAKLRSKVRGLKRKLAGCNGTGPGGKSHSSGRRNSSLTPQPNASGDSGQQQTSSATAADRLESRGISSNSICDPEFVGRDGETPCDPDRSEDVERAQQGGPGVIVGGAGDIVGQNIVVDARYGNSQPVINPRSPIVIDREALADRVRPRN